ncbi:SDR family NAD(P)-dependent oxidoreductase [Bacillus sp. CLL-7-23]|uniref:SDR family NAD(P)-dependent oxidoreductase n=1 Tax=Bacillus changyiensis TaxID=3004103 RepID=A0ABT4X6C0_9BACI|nr:SDR family NAD(P)-dependent oxidoreductase [Bacillus changyiensis]MDA7027844.1 SDR family NAD(P)-dependent oxidoreductase [Bacillus changyiensis]
MFNLSRKVVLVTGATRGIGKGTAITLAKNGAIVYFTGRTEKEFQGAVNLGGSLQTTEQEIARVGGTGYGIKCDHKDDMQTKMAVDRIISEQGKIDILVNNVWGGYEYFNDGTDFWNENGFWTAPISRFDNMYESGVRAHYVTTVYTVPTMIKQKNGLIINLSYWSAERNDMGVAYGMAKSATNKMTETMAYELKKHHISVVTIYPGLVRTESVIKATDFFDLAYSESTEFVGLAISALATDLNVLKKSGTKQIAAQIALDYGYKDIDGKQPIPLNKTNCQ